VEWLRVTDDLRTRIRNNELQTIVPKQSLEDSARSLVQQGITNSAETQRILGL
jgi:hypothetical protein